MLDPISITTEEVTRSWDQMPNEPPVWYNIFKNYYLPLGERRSLRNAFEFYIRVEMPKQYEDVDPERITYVPSHWGQYARDFEWARRAMEYDKEKVPDFGQFYVKQVVEYLQSHAMASAEALVKALNNERTRVQAGNSILNRIGVPESTEISLKQSVSISADEMAEATDKVAEWKTKRLSG